MNRSQKTQTEQNPKGEKMKEALEKLGVVFVPLTKEQVEAVKTIQKWLIECAEARLFN